MIPEHYKKFWKVVGCIFAIPTTLFLFALIFALTIILYIPSLGYSWNWFRRLMNFYERIMEKMMESSFGVICELN